MTARPVSPRRPGLSSFALHILAMALMLCDHLWASLLGSRDFLTYIGRLAFPIFAFMIAEGFFHTRSRKKYALRLLIFALVSELPFNLLVSGSLFYPLHQNVLWTFLLSVAAMALCERIKRRFSPAAGLLLRAAAAAAFFLAGMLTFVDYYGCGVLTVLLFYFTRVREGEPAAKRTASMLVQALGMYCINCEMLGGLIIPLYLFGLELWIPVQGFALLALPFIWLYNGRQGPYGKAIKYIYYLFYPAHLLILGGAVVLLHS